MTDFKEIENYKNISAENFEENSFIKNSEAIKATRNDFQISRRFFHMIMGFSIANAYSSLFTHEQVVYMLGTGACILYLIDQLRIAYPFLAKRFERYTRYLLRAEEQLKQSAAVPYAMAILLTILSFPQVIAVASIYTLAFADPLSAIIGIRFGKHKIKKGKSLEGSIAFLVAAFLSIALAFYTAGFSGISIWVMAFIVAVFAAIFELFPIKLDDNLTIPLFTAFMLRIVCSIMGINL